MRRRVGQPCTTPVTETPAEAPTPAALTVTQVARELGMAPSTVYGLLAPAGDLPCVRTQVGNSPKRRTHGIVRILRVDLEAWLARHRSAPVETPAPTPAPAPATAARRDAFRALPGADRYAS